MARLLYRQINDGVEEGPFEIVVPDGVTPEQYLVQKRASHIEKGWSVSVSAKVAHAVKDYPASERLKDPGAILHKERFMWVEQ